MRIMLRQATVAESFSHFISRLLTTSFFLLFLALLPGQPCLAGVSESQTQLKKIQTRIDRTEKQLLSKKNRSSI
jgi:hypothetical protein